MRENEKYWGRYADIYDEFADYVVGRELRHAIFSRLGLERDLGETIECGCGTGFYTRAVADNATSVVATDISEKMLNRARMNLNTFNNIRYERADCEDLIYPHSSFDTVLLANVLHVLARPRKAVEESFRVLRDEGRVLIITYTDYGLLFPQIAGVAMKFLASFGMPPPYGLRNYAPQELERMMADAGFRIEVLELIGDTVKAIYLKGGKRNPSS